MGNARFVSGQWSVVSGQCEYCAPSSRLFVDGGFYGKY